MQQNKFNVLNAYVDEFLAVCWIVEELKRLLIFTNFK